MTRQAARTVRSTERVRVELASAERLLGSLADRSIDLVITDPPYVTINRGSSGHLRDWFADGLSWPQIGRVFATARRKLKADGVLMAMTNNDGLAEALGALEHAGFSGVRTITWDRQYPGLGGGLRHQTEFVLVGRQPGSRTLSGVDLVSVAAVGPGTANRYPTAKPEGLGRVLARMAGIGPGSLVVDPFCGSGALLVGALERGATVVAGDVARRAVRLASARLAQAGAGRGRAPSCRVSSQARSGPRKPGGSRPPTTATKPTRPGKPSQAGKPSRSRSPTTATKRTRPRKPSGPRLARPGKPSGSRPPTTATKPTRPGKPSQAGKPGGSRPARLPDTGPGTQASRPARRGRWR
ncbi:MAG: hypothetical protein ABSA21_11325 [Candidatus Limnocylindrales bacterium]